MNAGNEGIASNSSQVTFRIECKEKHFIEFNGEVANAVSNNSEFFRALWVSGFSEANSRTLDWKHFHVEPVLFTLSLLSGFPPPHFRWGVHDDESLDASTGDESLVSSTDNANGLYTDVMEIVEFLQMRMYQIYLSSKRIGQMSEASKAMLMTAMKDRNSLFLELTEVDDPSVQLLEDSSEENRPRYTYVAMATVGMGDLFIHLTDILAERRGDGRDTSGNAKLKLHVSVAKGTAVAAALLKINHLWPYFMITGGPLSDIHEIRCELRYVDEHVLLDAIYSPHPCFLYTFELINPDKFVLSRFVNVISSLPTGCRRDKLLWKSYHSYHGIFSVDTNYDGATLICQRLTSHSFEPQVTNQVTNLNVEEITHLY